MAESEVLDGLKQAILDYDAEAAGRWAARAVEEGMDPLKALDSLTQTVKVIGDGFARGDYWLPDLIGAGEAMKGAMPALEAEIARRGANRPTPGVVVLGTVFGDMHDIGKAMVAALLKADGFVVHDLGINVTPEQFIDAAKKHRATIVAMSALMTSTVPEMRKVLQGLTAQGLRSAVKVMVGGGAITQEFADSIGADGYEPTAPGAVELARRLMST